RQAIDFPIESKDHSVLSVTQPDGVLDERFEHRLEIEGRAADDLQHLGRGGLLLQRLGKLPRERGIRALQLSDLLLLPREAQVQVSVGRGSGLRARSSHLLELLTTAARSPQPCRCCTAATARWQTRDATDRRWRRR